MQENILGFMEDKLPGFQNLDRTSQDYSASLARRALTPIPPLATAPRVFFLDMNSFYASVEQQDDAALRGRSVIVVAVRSENTSAIAASYEAKAKGIKTGTLVREARRLDRDVVVIGSRPERYLEIHKGILAVLARHFSDFRALSIDEMACSLNRAQAAGDTPLMVAREIKEDLARTIGECLRCSIGIAPNVFLAKVASDIQKPDGLIWLREDYPQVLERLEGLGSFSISDLPGIGAGVRARLRRSGIENFKDLWRANAADLRKAWGSVLGESFFFMLRGSLQHDYGVSSAETRSLGHAHVLAPAARSREGAEKVALRLTERALKRLRARDLNPAAVALRVLYRRGNEWRSWELKEALTSPTHDLLTWTRIVATALKDLPVVDGWHPAKVEMTFSKLFSGEDASLFQQDVARRKALSGVIDKIQGRYGTRGASLGIFLQNDAAVPRRITFGPPSAQED